MLFRSALLSLLLLGPTLPAAADDRPVAWSVPDVEMAGLVDAYQRAIRNAVATSVTVAGVLPGQESMSSS